MRDNIEQLHILIGLPGSGKTYWAAREVAEYHSRCYSFNKNEYCHIEVDALRKPYTWASRSRTDSEIQGLVIQYLRQAKVAYYDALVLNQESVENFISLVLKDAAISIENIILDYWNEDRDTCLYNDEGRREQNSIITIRKGILEKPSAKEIEAKFGIHTTLHQHLVVKKPEYAHFASIEGIELVDNLYMASDKWSIGGISRSRNGDDTPIQGEEPPTSFEKFDEIIEKIWPNIPHNKYVKLFKECVEFRPSTESDYYSSEDYLQYVCNMEKLYSMIDDIKTDASLMEYDGYSATIQFSVEDNVFFGTIIGISDSIYFHGSSVEELKNSMIECVEDYKQMLKENF